MQLDLPRAALESRPEAAAAFGMLERLPAKAFVDPDPFHEFSYPTPLAAKRAIADFLGLPLAKLPPDQLEQINTIVTETLNKQEVLARVRACVTPIGEPRHVE